MNRCLTSKIRKDKLCVQSIDMTDSKYQGMNYYANRELRTGYDMNKNDILLDKKLSRKDKITTLRHELIERRLMSKGWKYKKADKIALRYENVE
jgi:hypothetical protein